MSDPWSIHHNIGYDVNGNHIMLLQFSCNAKILESSV